MLLLDLIRASKDEMPEAEVLWALDMARSHCLDLSIGRATAPDKILFPTLALLSHSCTPNAKFEIYPNRTVAVLAQTAIGKGEEINISLVPVLEPTWKRRARIYR